MNSLMTFPKFLILCFLVFLAWSPVSTFADGSHEGKLGTVSFPTSGSGEAQGYFLRGVAALHSFWYEEALNSFRQSTKTDPGFVMGYWGEAMAHNHPLWDQQDASVAREALAKIKDMTRTTARERAYIEAVRILYGEGNKFYRDVAYARAMEKVHLNYPDDLEAACFYSLSLLGMPRDSENKIRHRVKAGALAMEVFSRNPDHPCAAHYTIHAFDHPDLAVLALPAARRYAEIAPGSHHAQHMPAHIFLQLGMWPEAAASNEAGWESSLDWVQGQGLSRGQRGYHSLQWLHYVYIQQGRIKKADQVFSLKLKDMMDEDRESKARGNAANKRVEKYYERMLGASVFERERWDLAETLKEPAGWKPKPYSKAVLLFVRGFSAAMLGRAEAKTNLASLNAIRRKGFKNSHFHRQERLDIWSLEIQAAMRASSKEYEEAIDLMKQATALEEKLPAPSGPPRIIKPTYELLGEILLRAGKPQEAASQFAISLMRHPNRARSLLGVARAAADSSNQQGAVAGYSKFLTVWSEADPDLPELGEARSYLEKHNTP
jgi:tetratricopeptide (TPR) repeat protein